MVKVVTRPGGGLRRYVEISNTSDDKIKLFPQPAQPKLTSQRKKKIVEKEVATCACDTHAWDGSSRVPQVKSNEIYTASRHAQLIRRVN